MPKQNQPKEEKREKGTAQAVIREILSWVIPFVIALAVAMFLKNYIIIIFVFFHLNSPRLKSYLSPIQFHSLHYKASRSCRSIQKVRYRVLQKI